MNHLTLYLLFATGQAAESNSVESRNSRGLTKSVVSSCRPARKPGIYQPCQPGPRTLRQASYRPLHGTKGQTGAARTWAFSASVIANAVGFLALASGTLLLLQIAQVSLT